MRKLWAFLLWLFLPEVHECDWKFQDDSFDHEFGCERVWYFVCEECGATRDFGPNDYGDSGFHDDYYER